MSFFIENETKQVFSVPQNADDKNGMADSANWTIVEMARYLLVQAMLTKTYWFLRAIATACYLRIRVSTKKINESLWKIYSQEASTGETEEV